MTYVLYSLQFAMMLLRGLTKKKFATMDEGDRDNARQILDSLVMAANQALADLDAVPVPPKKIAAASSAKAMTKAGGAKGGHHQPDSMEFSNLDHMILWHIVSQNEIALYHADRTEDHDAKALALLKEIRKQGEQRTADGDLAQAARMAKPILDGLTAQLSLATPDSQ